MEMPIDDMMILQDADSRRQRCRFKMVEIPIQDGRDADSRWQPFNMVLHPIYFFQVETVSILFLQGQDLATPRCILSMYQIVFWLCRDKRKQFRTKYFCPNNPNESGKTINLRKPQNIISNNKTINAVHFKTEYHTCQNKQMLCYRDKIEAPVYKPHV